MKKIQSYLYVLALVVATSLFSSCDEIVNRTLQSSIDEVKKELPITIDEGLVIDDITLGENGIVYHVTVDEDIYDMDAVKSVSSDIKKSMLDEWEESINDDQEMKDFIEAAVDFEKPINYKYEGNTSGNVVRIKISVNEMKQILGK